ncbi:sigma-54-dependent transcriptional regulator [Desulfobulbus oligotrophicus]|jgi:two-component system NtrC family response regulator|uniref:Sigma-54-dependent Fis family transcriptional regulator n=1 Tax=Desulfobulbus oligotrophicus TaxID=1909699 RepID=A0A7T5VEI7_9BACT|nr:sigma-54 dependent transcriptional regulator [Desulfobulbus oligotrophicus]MDY0390618.1 sigma-54 dependent transcriptional regulator [Desulfobulbus oligotrophicus]QQG66449.1 sigma-54-dependent Fis family transcriptional regulator [Desulfobulbus oligotrophicus]
MHTILIVDDEPNYLIVLAELLKDEGYEVFSAESGLTALPIVYSTDLDLVLSDMKMPGMDGIELLAKIKEYNRELPVILITAYAEVEKAVEAMSLGAFTYLAKPFSNQQLLASVTKAIEHYGLIREIRRLRAEAVPRSGFGGMVGKSPSMRMVYQLIEKVAPTPSSVLITGESGTGKELVARAIHNLSPRCEAPFISVNCAALSEHLLESELFGHEKGAFTDAVVMRKGRFELADTGTLFLDEIGEMSSQLQAKLLRVLQEKSFERVGGSTTQNVDIRILAATNKDLKDEVDKGNFREDLYYRLNVIHIHLTPLRERVDDIPALVTHFLEKNSRNLDKELDISPEALRLLVSLPWEGNVRELENTIERAAILCSSNRIEPEDVQPDSTELSPSHDWSKGLELSQFIPEHLSLSEVLNGIEEKLVRTALEDNFYVQARAAEQLGITKSLLQYKMKKYSLQRRKR